MYKETGVNNNILKEKICLFSKLWRRIITDHRLRSKIELELKNCIAKEHVLGRINRDGKLITDLPYFPHFEVLDNESTDKKTIKVSLVIRNGIISIKKDFGKKRDRFINEVLINASLSSKVNVPDLLLVDDKNNILYKSVVKGRTIRDLLVMKGAKILLEHTEMIHLLIYLVKKEVT